MMLGDMATCKRKETLLECTQKLMPRGSHFGHELNTIKRGDTWEPSLCTRMKIGNAKTNVEKVALSYCKGKGLDIGSSKWPLSNSRPIDFTEHENAYIIKETDSCIDYIFASPLIEHLDDIDRAFNEWKRVLKKNGILFLYVPHPACIMWNTDNNPYHYWNPSPLELVKLLEDNLFTVNEYSVLPDGYMSYYIVATNI